MMVLLDSKAADYRTAAHELRCDVGQLLTPLTQRADLGLTYAIDNGAYAQFNGDTFLRLLARQRLAKDRCLWVAVPDVVGSARRTREVFEIWAPQLRAWPLAYVCQDGQEDLDIPWSWIAAVFIGGTTRWKTSDAAVACLKAAQLLGKRTHVGRVNTPERAEWAERLGVDTIDGTGVSQYTHMREALGRRGKPLLEDTDVA